VTEQEAQVFCEAWQDILSLRDWHIKVTIKRERDMPLQNKSGSINWVLERKEALMTLVDPIDYPSDCMTPYDMEETIVHELLHLHIAPFDNTKDDSLEAIALEQCIHALEKAFIRIKRAPEGSEAVAQETQGY